jgi:molecular chaperone HscC
MPVATAPPPTRSGEVIVGIDLGTTNSLVAVLRDGAPLIIPNALGDLLTPSAVSALDDDSLLVGAPALARATVAPMATALAFKRDMGTDRRYQLGRRTFSPPELSAMVLRSLKNDAEAFLGHPVREAVITVPAYFDELQRRATQDAATIAGLSAERIINEPTAAAMAYGLHHREREFRAVVLDLGGGTFDVTVLEVMEGVIEIQSSAGDTRLGGEDFVDELARLVAQRSGHPDQLAAEPQAWARVRLACEHAKRQLSSQDEARVVLAGLRLGNSAIDIDQTITQAQAEATWAGLIARMRAPILRALRDAQAGAGQMQEVLLVGGATRMPCVARLAADIFQRLPSRSLPPDEAVAMGAAVQAALKARDAAVDDVVVTDVAPFSMGIAVASEVARRHVAGLFSPIIERGTVIPVSRVESFHTLVDNQKEIEVEVFQGEHSLCRDNRKLGAFKVGNLPPRPAHQVSIEVRFTYDLNGLLEVEARVPDTGQVKTVVFEQTPGRLASRQIEEARKQMERLKFHPRDALPNVTALSRAEAVFVEVTGLARERVGAAMAEFRALLDRQDPALIDESRERLLLLLSELRRG